MSLPPSESSLSLSLSQSSSSPLPPPPPLPARNAAASTTTSAAASNSSSSSSNRRSRIMRNRLFFVLGFVLAGSRSWWSSLPQLLLQQQLQQSQFFPMDQNSSSLLTMSFLSSTTSTAEQSSSSSLTAAKRKPRVLLGIFTMDTEKGLVYRRQFRRLFALDPVRTCTLTTVLETGQVPAQCQIIYTFVVGAGDPGGLSVRTTEPFLVPVPVASRDADHFDMTFLNIRENMNEGKSPSWFAYAAHAVLDQYGIDYVAKSDTDTLLFLDRMLDFLNHNLPPIPYNRHILAGFPQDKHGWWKNGNGVIGIVSAHQLPKELWFAKAYDHPVHLYAAGQFYLLSPDLATAVAKEAWKQQEQQQTLLRLPPKPLVYMEGPEDHDVSTMAFHGSLPQHPIQFILMGKHNIFWQHPVKVNRMGRIKFEEMWNKEITRVQQVFASSSTATATAP